MAKPTAPDPKAPKTERLQIVASVAFIQSLDGWRSKQPDNPNRSEAVRRLVETALKQKPSIKT